MRINKKNWKNIFLIGLLLLLTVVAIATTTYTITFNYDTDELSGDVATLYFDYGNGYSENLSSYVTIDGDKVTFPLKKYREIRKLRFVPVREAGKKSEIVSAEIKTGNFSIKKLSEDNLVNLLTENSNVLVQNSGIYVEKKEGEDYNQLEFPSTLIRYKKRIIPLMMEAIRKLLCFGALIIIGIVAYYVGSSRPLFPKSPIYSRCIIGLILAAEYFITQNSKWLIAGVGFFIVFLLIGKLGLIWNSTQKRSAYFNLVVLSGYSFLISRIALDDGILFFGYLVLLFLVTGLLIGIFNEKTESTDKDSKGNIDIVQISGLYVRVMIVYILFYIMKNILINSNYDVMTAVYNCDTQIALMNITWMFIFISVLYFFLGNGIANVLFAILSLVLLIGNYIKISYHDTYLTPMDFWQIGDMIRISGSIVDKRLLIGIVVLCVGFVILLIKFRKQVAKYLIPHINVVAGIVTCIVCVFCTKDFLDDKYMEAYNVGYKWYVTAYIGEETSGMYLYNMFNVAHMGDNAVTKPEDYTEAHALELKKEFEEYKTGESTDTFPNIICIMAESLFDIENIDSLTFNQEIEPTIHKYMKSTLISPRFGGYTAAVEYEALTGHSLYFYKDGTMPYTTYYSGKTVNSVASELKKDGYATIACHPNTGDFYSREKAYSKMDFDKMYTIADFDLSDSDYTVAGYCRDIPFADKVIDIMDSQTSPTFLFGVSIAGHYTSEDHYAKTDITVEGNDLTDDDKHILEQTAAAYQESDEMLRKLIEYVDECEKPTILYVFGDHLPPLPMYEKLNYIENPVNKYGTVLVGYSNYKDIEFPQYMTPNQLGPQMLIDAEVEHNSYWDYIYSLREKYPVIQKEFISTDAAENLETYRFIQYDLMFGKKWMLDDVGE